MAFCVVILTLLTSLKTYFELLRSTFTSHTTLLKMIKFWVILDKLTRFFFEGYGFTPCSFIDGCQITQWDIQESCTFSSHCCENLKFYKIHYSMFMILFYISLVQIITCILIGWIKTNRTDERIFVSRFCTLSIILKEVSCSSHLHPETSYHDFNIPTNKHTQ
jgi:hypothetical protein